MNEIERFWIRPVARSFYGGGGGGAYLKNRDQIINVWIIRHGTSEVTRWQCPTYRPLNWNRANFNGAGNVSERRMREPLGECGVMPPRKFSNLKAWKRHFQHSRADSCVKTEPKIDCYFFSPQLWRKERCHQLCYIFIINNYLHTPLMLVKYDTSFLPRTKTCTLYMYFYLLFVYPPPVYSYLSGNKNGH